MANPKIISEMRDILKDEERIPTQVVYRLILASQADTLEEVLKVTKKVEVVEDKVDAMTPWVGALKWFLFSVGGLVIVLLFSMLTHGFTWPF